MCMTISKCWLVRQSINVDAYDKLVSTCTTRNDAQVPVAQLIANFKHDSAIAQTKKNSGKGQHINLFCYRKLSQKHCMQHIKSIIGNNEKKDVKTSRMVFWSVEWHLMVYSSVVQLHVKWPASILKFCVKVTSNFIMVYQNQIRLELGSILAFPFDSKGRKYVDGWGYAPNPMDTGFVHLVLTLLTSLAALELLVSWYGLWFMRKKLSGPRF